jgi:hypothetical protein
MVKAAACRHRFRPRPHLLMGADLDPGPSLTVLRCGNADNNFGSADL